MAANERILLTPQGKLDLEEELRHLREDELPELKRRMMELSEAGDVSDDSDFEATKEELIQLEARIRDIEMVLEEAEIVEHSDGGEMIEFGSTVTIVDDTGEEATLTIVGPQEANAQQGRISNVSPIGSALMGKRVGDKVSVHAPGGEFVYEIREVR